MKKVILIIPGFFTTLLLLIAIVGIYKFNYSGTQTEEFLNEEISDSGIDLSDHKNTTYSIADENVILIDGTNEKNLAPDSALKIRTEYFGNEVEIDLNNDGRKDKVFLLTQNTGGSGTFFYIVAALNTIDGHVGSHGFFLGDRIAPQTTEISQNPNHKNVIVVNYFDRNKGESLAAEPTVGKSVWLKFDPEIMMFGEVEQDFPGEADPEVMTLSMKSWTWVRTVYNDIEIMPKEADAFKITFEKNGAVGISTDCNKIGGSYEVNEEDITFSPMAATEMYCEDSQELEFSNMFRKIKSFSFNNKGELLFQLGQDEGFSIFR